MKYYVKNLNETKLLACKFAKELQAGDFVVLTGDLGAGKTTFTQFVFANLGVKEIVTSPTFSVLKSYQARDFVVHHFDSYRITTSEAIECGFDEILTDKSSCIFIEWADKIKELLPSSYIEIKIKIVNENEREIEIIKK